jgi:hypothetical protein
MYGGWKSQFYIGYSIPTESILYRENRSNNDSPLNVLVDSSSERYELSFNFFPVFIDDLWIENMEIRVILPEGCTDITSIVPLYYGIEKKEIKRLKEHIT